MRIALHNDSVLELFVRLYCVGKKKKAIIFQNVLIFLSALINKKTLSVMLADDDADSRDIFVEALSMIAPHVQVKEIVNGKELMKNLLSGAEAVPDILFLDLNMPFKNGQECLAEIRSTPRLQKMPVVIYSSSNNREHVDQTYKGGASFYMIKPDSFVELKQMVNKLLSLEGEAFLEPKKEHFLLSGGYLK